MIQIFLIQIFRGVCERTAFPILTYLAQLRDLFAHLLDIERGFGSISTKVVYPTYRNEDIKFISINKSLQLSPCILIFLILFKRIIHPRLDLKGIIELFLAFQEGECPITSGFSKTRFLE